MLCYANANLTRADQAGEVMRFVEFWHEVAGHDPRVAVLRLQGDPLPRTEAAERQGHSLRHHPPARCGGGPPPAEGCPPATGRGP